MTQSVAEILNGAADYIETNGWWHNDMFGPPTVTDKPCACAVGAIFAAENPAEVPRGDRAYDAAQTSQAVAFLATNYLGGIPNDVDEAEEGEKLVAVVTNWNDIGRHNSVHPAADVIEGLRKAALRAEEAGA